MIIRLNKVYETTISPLVLSVNHIVAIFPVNQKKPEANASILTSDGIVYTVAESWHQVAQMMVDPYSADFAKGQSAVRTMGDVEQKLGAWMSSALDDPAVCDAMKDDVRQWFDQFKESVS